MESQLTSPTQAIPSYHITMTQFSRLGYREGSIYYRLGLKIGKGVCALILTCTAELGCLTLINLNETVKFETIYFIM